MNWLQRFFHLAPPTPEPQPEWPPIPDDRTFSDVFEFGYCHVLALAVHELTGGWQIVHMGADGGRVGSHYLVRQPDGRLLDIRGARTEDEVRAQWDQDGPRSVLNDRAPEDIISLVIQGDMEDPAPIWDLAQHVARTLVPEHAHTGGGWVYQQPRITGGYDFDVTFPGNPDCDRRLYGLDTLLDFLRSWRRIGHMEPGTAQVIDLNTDLVWDAAAFLDHHTRTEPIALVDPTPEDVETAVAVALNTFRLDATAAGTVVGLLVDHGDVADDAVQEWLLDRIREQLHDAGDYFTAPELVSQHLALILQGET